MKQIKDLKQSVLSNNMYVSSSPADDKEAIERSPFAIHIYSKTTPM